VQFLQVVGLTADELALARRWHTDGVFEQLALRDPLLITDLGRPSILADTPTKERLEAPADAEATSGRCRLGSGGTRRCKIGSGGLAL
jgi:hypothetical protein